MSSTLYIRTTPRTCIPTVSNLHRTVIVNRNIRRRLPQARSLWWWGQHSTWSSSNDDTHNEHMHKYRRMMRYRYSRALKRRALWERENSPALSSLRDQGRHLMRAWCRQPLSTTEQPRAKLKDDKTDVPRSDVSWEDMHRDFEAFKAAIDREIAKDPYKVLFGRRWLKPLAFCTGVSTTCPDKELFSETDTQGNTQAKKVPIQDLDESKLKYAGKHREITNDMSGNQNITGKSEPQDDDYIYDPILGRKRPKTVAVQESQSAPKKSFLETLFAEHGTEDQPKPLKDLSPPAHVHAGGARFENSRAHAWKEQRASILGTSIATTAEFESRCVQQLESDNKQVAQHVNEESPSQNGPAPFAGTVFASRGLHEEHDSLSSSRPPSTGQVQQANSASAPETSTKARGQERLEPSLDRLQSENTPADRKFVTKLQPATDRIVLSKPKEVLVKRPAPLDVTAIPLVNNTPAAPVQRKDLAPDTREDLDLLRASDVRAAVKTVRVTRNALKEEKTEKRKQLEVDFTNLREGPVEVIKKPTRLSATLSDSSIKTVVKHVKKYPNGIVAKEMRSLGFVTDAFKRYEKPSSSRPDLLEKIQSDERALDKLPSIYTSRGQPVRHAVVPESVATQEHRDKFTREVKSWLEDAEKAKRVIDKQIIDLARDVKGVYDSDLESRGLSNNDSSEYAKSSDTSQSKSCLVTAKQGPLNVATVKPGVERHLAIERYTQEFEPKFAALVDQAKMIHRSIREVNGSLETMKSAQVMQASVGLEEKSDQIKDSKSGAMQDYRSTFGSDQQGTTGVTLAGSTAGTPPERLPVTPPVFQSSFVILTYNKSSQKVDVTQVGSLLNERAHATSRSNPITVMSDLTYPAAFVPQFVELEKAGYKLLSGRGDMLIFQKSDSNLKISEPKVKDIGDSTESMPESMPESIPESMLGSKHVSEFVAGEKAPNQIMERSAFSPLMTKSTTASKSASSSSEIGHNSQGKTMTEPLVGEKKDRKPRKVKRQEQVFSGTIRPKNDGGESSFKRHSQYFDAKAKKHHKSRRARFGRRVVNVSLNIVGIAGAAYVIGAVCEGMEARTQINRDSSDVENSSGTNAGTGPRKRLVMPAGYNKD